MPLPVPNQNIEAPQEQGFPWVPVEKDPLNLPPTGGGFVLPHFATFGSMVNFITRTYRYSWDEAYIACVRNALAMRNEPVVMQALRTRQMPVAQLGWHITPKNPMSMEQKEAAKLLTDIVKATPKFQQFRRVMQEAVFYGKYGLQLAFSWDYSTGSRRLVSKRWVPVNGDKILYKWDGRAGILVQATYTGPTELTDRGMVHFFDPRERQSFIVHDFEPEDADFYSPELAGSIHGIGIRSRIYWLWWMRNHVFQWMMDYLERVGGGGYIILYYEHGNDASYNEVKRTFEAQLGRNILLFPRYRDNTTGGPGIEMVAPNVAGQELLWKLISEYFDAVIRRYILGTNGTADQGPTGVGDGWADLHAGEFARIVKYDAVDNQETMTEQYLSVLNQYNCPGNPCPSFDYEIDKPNVDEFMQGVKQFWEMGGTVDEPEVRDILGIGEPLPGHGILSKMQPQAPVPIIPGQGVQEAPGGVPFEGAPGPNPQQMEGGQ